MIKFLVIVFVLLSAVEARRNKYENDEPSQEDYYQILGVRKTATDAQIKKAYRKLSLKYHPDKNKEANAKETFIKISNAYETLIDKDKRAKYDQFGADGPDADDGFKFDDANDIFSKFFKGGFGEGGGGPKFSFSFGSDGDDDFFGDGGFPNFGGFEEQEEPAIEWQHVHRLEIADWPFSRRQKGIDKQLLWFVLFYHNSAKLHSIADKFEGVARTLKDICEVSAVDCEEEGALCERYGIAEGVPATYLFFPYLAHGSPKTFSGSMKEAVAFVLKHVPSFAIPLEATPEVVLPFYALDFPKVVLFSNKSDVGPVFRSLSQQFRQHMTFAFASGSGPGMTRLVRVNGVKQLPFVKIILPGGLEVLYEGRMKHKHLVRWINDHLSETSFPTVEIGGPAYELDEDGNILDSKKLNVILFTQLHDSTNNGIRMQLNSLAAQFKREPLAFFHTTVYRHAALRKKLRLGPTDTGMVVLKLKGYRSYQLKDGLLGAAEQLEKIVTGSIRLSAPLKEEL